MSRTRTPLTLEQAQKFGGAIHRLNELDTATIAAPSDAAERAGIIKFLQEELVPHADELIASWFAVTLEYEPLVGSFAAMLNRANNVIQRSLAAKQQQSQPPAPENVIQLERAPKK